MFGTWVNPNAPDVILEVGPHPCSSRFAAHSALLATHSGYLRAALRTLEQQHSSTVAPLRRVLQHHSNGGAISVPSEMCALPATTSTTSLLYLPNVSPEQFTPLLSYMYTGYLDLTMDNIFGVLLATHLLHMPRALELCRTYLSSSASAASASTCTSLSEPLQRNFFASKTDTPTTPTFSAANGASRLVRPIASKPMATIGLHFIAPPTASQINLLPSASFRSLDTTVLNISTENPSEEVQLEVLSASQSPISVTRFEEESRTDPTPQNSSVLEGNSNNIDIDLKCDENISKSIDHKHADENNTKLDGVLDNENRGKKSNLHTGCTKRQRTQQDAINDGSNSVIIDIASCDGPVRFRRVLNVMYGCNTNSRGIDCADRSVEDASYFNEAENNVKKRNTRALRYASSFHQQMARNISNTGKLAYESSSSSSNSSCQKFHSQQTQVQPAAAMPLTVQQEQDPKDENSQGDVTPIMTEAVTDTEGNSNYTCVYCKHTFKSHYCYQKHAKRHLIPLCIDSRASCAVSTTVKTITAAQPRPNDARRRSHQSSTNSNSNTIRREVKPLDMNVQYYPCKTCGSKFPSYYFVHKHRKLCHTEEEDDNTNLSASTSTYISKESNNEVLQTEHAGIDPEQGSDLLANVDHTPHGIEQH
uniref:BTB domain-containing protein n=1 Tax=Anopheles christyi TaxID=43041 RepID=A0A182JTJ3_9DIPT